MQKSDAIGTRTLLRVGLIANILESYAFSIYNFLAPTLGQLFLEPADPGIMYIKSYLLFCCGFISRPLGGIVWGYCADRIGRSRTLTLSLILMAVPSVLISILPTYSQIGVWATISFLLLRFIQGFSKGGEHSISGCYVYEATRKDQRSLLCGVVGASTTIGLLGGSCTAWLLHTYFDQATLLAWGWRVPYLIGIPITFWIARVRKSIIELKSEYPLITSESTVHSEKEETRSFVLRLLPLILIVGFMEVCSYTLFVWLPSYLHQFLGVDTKMAQFCNTMGLGIWIGFTLLSGYFSSLFGYRRMIIVHTIAMMVMVIPLFKLLTFGTYSALLAAYIVFAWLQSGIPAVTMEMLGDAFPKKTRALGMSLSQNFGATLFGSTAPLIGSITVEQTKWAIFPAFYIVGLAMVVLLIVLFKPWDQKDRQWD